MKWPLLVLGMVCLLVGCASSPPAKTGVASSESTTQQNESVPEQKTIHKVSVSELRAAALVTVHANQPLTYTAVKHQFPLGVVLYFPDTTLKGVHEAYAPRNALIKAVQTSELKRKRPSSRIEIRLKEDVAYKVTRSEKQILVHFTKPAEKPNEAKEPEKGFRIAQHDRGSTRKEIKSQPPVKTEAPITPKEEVSDKEYKKPASVSRIDFQTTEAGKSRVIVETSRKIRYETHKTSSTRVLLKLLQTRIPKFQKRPLITTRFNSAVDRVVPIQTPKMGDTAIIAIELREPIPYRVQQRENTCFVDFDASSVPPRPMPEAERPRWIEAMKEAEALAAVEIEGKPEKPVVTKEGKEYTGEKISLDFQDADIHNIFRILHEVSGKNFVIGDDVKGRVTLKLENVPWDQVLDLILKMNQLGTVTEGNVVRIAKLSTLEAEQKALQAKAKAEREAKELEPLHTEYIELDYADAASLRTHLNEVKSDRGKVTIDKGTNLIIIKDEKGAIAEAKALISRLDAANKEIATRQVVIEARIVQADTSFTRDIGVQWGGSYEWAGHDGNAQVDGTVFGVSDSNFAVNLPPASFTSGLGFTFGRIGGTTLSLEARLLAMEERGKGRTISAPKVLTLDNQKATIKQITRIPFQVTEEQTTSIQTEEAGIELSVTPQITRDNRIRMQIYAEKGAPDWSNTVAGNPAIDTNTAETVLFINDGQTIVIGGILTMEDTVATAGVPLFSKIPLLGWLFKQRRNVNNKQELLIFITPKIIRLEEEPRIS